MVPPVSATIFIPAAVQTFSSAEAVSPALANNSDAFLLSETQNVSLPCGEILPRPAVHLPYRGECFLAAAVLMALGISFTLAEKGAEGEKTLGTAASWMEGGRLWVVLGLSLFAVMGFVYAVSRSSRRPPQKSELEAQRSEEITPSRRRTRLLTQRLPVQDGAPTKALEIERTASAPATIHDLPTGPILIDTDGKVETALPDDPTKGRAIADETAAVPSPVTREKTGVLLDHDGRPFEGAVMETARTGNTERIVEGAEDAAPRHFLGPAGTRRLTERISVMSFHAVTAASPTPEAELKTPDWALGVSLWKATREDPANWRPFREWKRSQALYLRGFRTRWEERDFLSGKIRTLAAQLEQEPWPEGLHPSEVGLVVAYLQLVQMNVRSPFDLPRELGRFERLDDMRKSPFKDVSGLAHALRSEREEIQALLQLEPDAGNRKILERALRDSARDLSLLDDHGNWPRNELDLDPVLDPFTRVLFLLCRKRAEDKAFERYLKILGELRSIERDPRGIDRKGREDDLQRQLMENESSAKASLKSRPFDILSYWRRFP
jgi:hypothetical protein